MKSGEKDKIDSGMKNWFYAVCNSFLRIPNFILYSFLFLSLITIQFYSFNLNYDLALQLNSLVNFANHHGITASGVNNNYELVYLPVSYWPAGLVMFLLPIFLVVKNAVLSTWILNSVSYIFYILFLEKYLDHLEIKSFKKKFIILFLIISIAPFVYFYPSDTLATVICLWGFYFNLKYEGNGKTRFLILSIFLIGLTYFIKYSFLPFVFYPFASFILKERQFLFQKKKQFIIIFLLSLVTVGFFYFLNLSIVGKNDVAFATALDMFHGNAHWKQLSHLDGFLFTFGMYETVIQRLFSNHSNLNVQFNWISILVTLYIYLLFLKVFFKKKSNWYSKTFMDSINISLTAGSLIIAFLTFLTVNNAGQNWITPYWTFVQETRYYGPVIVIGLINLLIIFLNEKKALLLHVIVPVMILFNLLAFKATIQLGFWGHNYKDYSDAKKKIYSTLKKSDRKRIIFYNEKMFAITPYRILKSEGEILAKDSLFYQTGINKEYSLYLLKKDSIQGFSIQSLQ